MLKSFWTNVWRVTPTVEPPVDRIHGHGPCQERRNASNRARRAPVRPHKPFTPSCLILTVGPQDASKCRRRVPRYETLRHLLSMGERGRAFTLTFRPACAEAGLAEKKDKFSNQRQHLFGRDPGGIRPPTAAQLAADANHVNAMRAHQGQAAEICESEYAFDNRSDALVVVARKHVLNKAIVKDIDNMILAPREQHRQPACT